MDSLEQQLQITRHRVVPIWNDRRAQDVLHLTRVRQRLVAERRRDSIVGGSVFVAAAALLLGYFGQVGSEATRVQIPAMTVAPAAATATRTMAARIGDPLRSRVLPLKDGSQVESHPGSRLRVLTNQADHIALTLDEGSASFDVVPNRTRQFEIQVADARISVLGTVFTVDRGTDQVRVSVTRGRVRVDGPEDSSVVAGGQSQTFDLRGHKLESASGTEPDAGRAEEAPQAAPRDAADKPVRGADAAPTRSGRQPLGSRAYRAWRSLAKAGDYEAAYRAMRVARRQIGRTGDPGVLLDAADTARLSGHPEEASVYLERVTKHYPRSPVAPLAAFTLGRICLDQLGQPHRAADAFALTFRLSPQGSLAQDALAREVEALSKGGREHEAYLQAQEYVKQYPDGRRLRAVRAYGNLE